MTKYNRPRNDEFREMLANEYQNTNISIKELSEKYHTDAAYQLQKYGIKLKGRGVQKMLTRNGCISYKWDASDIVTEEQAYTLGFFMADGHNSGAQAGIKVKISDLDILEKMKKCFSDEIKTHIENGSCSFVISSTMVCNNLLNNGIIRDKSHNEKAIPRISQELLRHFIRGYFDGDGTIFICKKGKTNYLKCNICSSTKNILEQIQKVFADNDIQSTINVERRIGKTYNVIANNDCVATMDMYRLYIRKKCSVERLFHYLYDDSKIYLSRKHDIFANNQEMFIYTKHVNTELTK